LTAKYLATKRSSAPTTTPITPMVNNDLECLILRAFTLLITQVYTRKRPLMILKNLPMEVLKWRGYVKAIATELTKSSNLFIAKTVTIN
jgi:hypothetical protein